MIYCFVLNSFATKFILQFTTSFAINNRKTMRLHANGTKTLSNANIQRCRTPTTEHFRWWNSLCTITSVYVMLMMFDFRLQQNSFFYVKDFADFSSFSKCHRECQNRNDFYCCFTLRTTTRDALSIIVKTENLFHANLIYFWE